MAHIYYSNEDMFIINNYRNKTYKEIADTLGLTESQVKHRIQRHLNITPSKRKKHYHNEAFFITDSADKYYILGLMCADGNLYNDNCKNKYKVSLSLHTQDISLLRNINKLICDTNIISERKTSKVAELVVYNEKIYKAIKSHNINENKSLTMTEPTNIPDEYIKDFIRGYFDGNGSLSLSKQVNYEKLTIQFLGTTELLSWIMTQIYVELGIDFKNITSTKTKIKCLRYFTREARIILDWLYNDCNLKLERKYNKYINYRIKFND